MSLLLPVRPSTRFASTTGTRQATHNLFDAELQVFEGMSRAQFLFAPTAPESKEMFEEIAKFFDQHLGT
jgi:hypothetical protein